MHVYAAHLQTNAELPQSTTLAFTAAVTPKTVWFGNPRNKSIVQHPLVCAMTVEQDSARGLIPDSEFLIGIVMTYGTPTG